MRANFFIAVVAVCITMALCSCFFGPMQEEKTVSGKIRKYCEYEGIQIMKGAKFDTLDCLRCACSENGFECCGIGYKAGVIQPPPGCDILHDGCEPLLVMSKDYTKRCGTGKPVLISP
uniref:Metal binding protein n=1 Tax=Sinohyriopsis cumingii TaxID=165450 RepID=L7PD08_SINCU|nr:metal binding protein [Sinohyriopsis cumingii]